MKKGSLVVVIISIVAILSLIALLIMNSPYILNEYEVQAYTNQLSSRTTETVKIAQKMLNGYKRCQIYCVSIIALSIFAGLFSIVSACSDNKKN